MNLGEVIHTEAVASGDYIISGGQIKITSAASFQVSSGASVADNANSEFLSGFVKKDHDEATNSSDYEFKVLGGVDANSLDVARVNAVAASSSYTFELSTENSNEPFNSVTVKPKSTDELTATAIAEAVVSELRGTAPQTKFVGNEFEFSDGFPESQVQSSFNLGTKLT